MKRLALALGACLLTNSAGFAAPPIVKPPACPYRPGEALKVTMRISVRDRSIQADSATLNLDTHIPAGGRMVAGTYVAPPLSLVPVHLVKDTLKHFSVTPHFVIEDAGAPDCKLLLDSMIGGRGWALQDTTHFSVDATITTVTTANDTTNAGHSAGGEIANSFAVHQDLFVSCLDQDVPVRLSSGELIPIKDVVAGDLVSDPLTGERLRVSAVIWGTQANERMYRLGYGNSSALFTAQHPVLTRRGLVAAADLTSADAVLGEDGSYHAVTIREPRAGDARRSVYNLRFEYVKPSLGEHLLAANGIVTGDFDVQNRLAAGKKQLDRPGALVDGSLRVVPAPKRSLSIRDR